MNGSKIIVIEGDIANEGEIACFSAPEGGLFGVRIDIPHVTVMDSNVAPPKQGKWGDIGHASFRYFCLSEDQIGDIRKSEDGKIPFQIKIS